MISIDCFIFNTNHTGTCTNLYEEIGYPQYKSRTLKQIKSDYNIYIKDILKSSLKRFTVKGSKRRVLPGRACRGPPENKLIKLIFMFSDEMNRDPERLQESYDEIKKLQKGNRRLMNVILEIMAYQGCKEVVSKVLKENKISIPSIEQIKIKTMPNLNGVLPITEADKADMINWLGSTLDYLQDNAADNYNNNRVFGTDNDDIDEAKNILGRMFLTLQKNTLVPKLLLILLMTTGLYSCNSNPPVVYQQPVYQQPAPVVQQQMDPYQVYDNGTGGQVVYYTDPTSHTSYWLEYALFMSMWNSPNRYYSINHYYVSHRSYIDSRSGYYRSSYTRRSSPTGNSNRLSSPSGNRPSSPGRPTGFTRPSSPTSTPSYSPRPSSVSSSSSRSSGSSRSSSPRGGRH